MALGLRSGVARSIVPRTTGDNTAAVPIPDISTKEKAQRYIGLDPEKLNNRKQKFLKTVVPKWLEEAKAKGKLVAMK